VAEEVADDLDPKCDRQLLAAINAFRDGSVNNGEGPRMPEKPNLEIDSPPEMKLEALRVVAEISNSDLASIVCRDDEGKLLSVSVHARGESAAALERWLKRQEKRP
jgi:hypothetical protein